MCWPSPPIYIAMAGIREWILEGIRNSFLLYIKNPYRGITYNTIIYRDFISLALHKVLLWSTKFKEIWISHHQATSLYPVSAGFRIPESRTFVTKSKYYELRPTFHYNLVKSELATGSLLIHTSKLNLGWGWVMTQMRKIEPFCTGAHFAHFCTCFIFG